MAPYHENAELADIYLEDSLVLDVLVAIGSVRQTLDVVLREGHPAYRPPRDPNQLCYRRGTLTFEPVAAVTWRMPTTRPAIDADGEADWGGIDRYDIEPRLHRLVGEFGELTISADARRLILADR